MTTPFLNYDAGLLTKPTTGEVLANIREPYFNRTYDKFNGHRETPYTLSDSPYPAVLRNGNILFLAHPLDQLYYVHGVRMHRELVKNAIDLMYRSPILKVKNLPSAGRANLLKQGKDRRYVVHLLYAPALNRGEVQVIEDFLPVPNVEITLEVPEQITEVLQIPQNKTLEFTREGDKTHIKVPTFTIHTGIVLKY